MPESNTPEISTQTALAALALLEASTSSGQVFTVDTLPIKKGNQSLSALAFDKYVLSSKLLSITSARIADSAILRFTIC